MKVAVSIRIIDDNGNKAIGNGIIWLLENIESTGSISAAAKKMGMAYSKAWKILKNLESFMGAEILIKNKGGFDKGGATLTPIAKIIVKVFEDYKMKVAGYSEKIFNAEMKKIIENSRKPNENTGSRSAWRGKKFVSKKNF